MAEKLIMENPYVSLVYDDTNHIVYHTVLQPVTGEPLRQILNAGVELLKKHKSSKWLSDDRKNGPLSEDDVRYGSQDWGPRAAAAGWKYWALVVPESLAGRDVMSDLINTYFEMGVRVAIFSKLDEAKAWLNKQV